MNITIRIPSAMIPRRLVDYLSSCRSKVRYGHKQTANDAVAAMASRGKPGLEAYRCRHCGGCHIGHRREVQP